MKHSLRFRAVLTIAILLLATQPAQGSAQTGNQLFEQALTKERAEGKLEEAIGLYQRILREHATEHPLAAKTLVQLGRAYERLGKDEARKAYDRVLNDYPDQADAVKEARDRIAALGTGSVAQQGTTGGVTARRVLARSFASRVTPDGRTLLGEDSTGNLAALDLQTGRVSPLTHVKSDFDEFMDEAIGSEDGRLVAYAWWNGPKTQWELRVVDRTTGSERVLVSDTSVSYIRPYVFTRDNKFVVAGVSPVAGSVSTLSLVSSTSGERQRLVTYRGRDPQNAALSPDGRFLVYDVVAEPTGGSRDIRIFTMSTRADTVLVHHPANDFAPAWSPKGDGVFFVSNRDGSRGGWYVPVQGGRAMEPPRLVFPNLGTGFVLGLTRGGDLYYSPARVGRRDLYLADFDPSAARLAGEPRPIVARTAGSNEFPSWSADAKHVIYTAGANSDRAVRVRNAQTGTESETRVAAQRSRLLSDSTAVISQMIGGAWRLSLLDLGTGRTTPLVSIPESGYLARFEPTRDGQLLYYLVWKDSRHGSLMRYDFATGTQRAVVESRDGEMFADFALSPDGRQAAVAADDRQGKRPGLRLRLVQLDGDTTANRLLGHVDGSGGTFAGWLPDARGTVMFIGGGLWLVPTDATAPRKLNVKLAPRTSEAILSPDGRHLALRVDGDDGELWVAQRFLPAGGK